MLGQMLIFSGLGLGFMFLGYLIKNRKHYNLIAGYNTLSQAEKSKIDIVGLASLCKLVLVAMGLLMIGVSLFDYSIGSGGLTPSISGMIMLAGTLYLIIKSRKFKQK